MNTTGNSIANHIHRLVPVLQVYLHLIVFRVYLCSIDTRIELFIISYYVLYNLVYRVYRNGNTNLSICACFLLVLSSEQE